MPTALVKNRTNFARTGIVTLGVPFARALGLQESDTLVVNNALTDHTDQIIQWYPQGIRWDDGSVKYARCTFRTDLLAQEEKQVTISIAAPGTAFPYNINPNLITDLLGTVFTFRIGDPPGDVTYQIPMTSVLENLEEGGGPSDHYGRYRYFTHLPDSLSTDPKIKYFWVELTVEIPSDLRHVQFYFRFGFYRFYPDMPNEQGIEPCYHLNGKDVKLFIIGPRTHIIWEQYKIPTTTHHTDTNIEYKLINAAVANENRMAAASSHCYKGIMAWDNTNSSNAELVEQILAIAEDWKTSFPVTGIMPERPPYITSDADALNRSNNLEQDMRVNMVSQPGTPSPYLWPNSGPNPNTADAGQHGYKDYAYGIRGWPIMSTANYNWIPYLEFCTRQGSVRHNWYLGDDGNPVPPNDFISHNVLFWGGSMFGFAGLRFCGFNRGVNDQDVCRIWTGAMIIGPDKEHFTITMNMIQCFITMDWFSLMYADMYAKYWIYSQRTDTSNDTINDWGTSRSTGRTYQNAAFLHEFLDDSELEFWIRTRLHYNLGRPGHRLLDHTLVPGGTEVIRAANIQSPCVQPACLPAGNHWRAWEEGQAALGFYFVAKSLLCSDPTDPEGLRMLQIARDISATVVLHGYAHGDGRPGESTFKFVQLIFPSIAACDAFIVSIGSVGLLPHTLNSVGLDSGAQGKIYFYHKDNEVGGFSEAIQLKIFLKDASGPGFIAGEQFQLPTGQTGPVRFNHYLQGAKAKLVTSPTNGYARALSDADIEVLSVTDPGAIPGVNPEWPVGITRNVRWSVLYAFNIIQCLSIAKEAALLEFYADSNDVILAKSLSLLNYMISLDHSSTTDDYEEGFQCFMGYLIPDLLSETGQSGVVFPLATISTMGQTTVTIANPTVNVSIEVPSFTMVVELQQVSVNTSTATNIRVLPESIDFQLSTQVAVGSGGATKAAGFSTFTFTTSEVDSVRTTAHAKGRRVTTFVYIGEPVAAQAPIEGPHENGPADPNASEEI